jgi:hypothetical protein
MKYWRAKTFRSWLRQAQRGRGAQFAVLVEALEVDAGQVAVVIGQGMGDELGRQGVLLLADLELAGRHDAPAEGLAVDVIQRCARAGVGAVAQAHRRLLARHLAQRDDDRRRSGLHRVDDEFDERGLEQLRALQMALPVGEQCLGVGLAGLEVEQVAHRVFGVVRQASDAQLPEAGPLSSVSCGARRAHGHRPGRRGGEVRRLVARTCRRASVASGR